MTFTITITREPCSIPIIMTLAGPLITFGLAWLGMFLLRSRKYGLFAYALVFASFAHLRFIQTLTGRGDELILAQEWFGISGRPIVAIFVLLIGIPPIMAAFRAIANHRRGLVFICSWLLPLPLLFLILVGNRILFGENGNETLGASVLGITLTVFVTDLLAIALLIAFRRAPLLPKEKN